MSSGLMLRFPINAWNVGLSFERTLTVRLSRLMRGAGSALDGTGSGILPLGPRIGPKLFPIDGINGASAIKKSISLVVDRISFLSPLIFSMSSGEIIRSAPPLCDLIARSPLAKTPIFVAFPRPFGRTMDSVILFFGWLKSTLFRLTIKSTLSVNFLLGANSIASLTALRVFSLTILPP